MRPSGGWARVGVAESASLPVDLRLAKATFGELDVLDAAAVGGLRPCFGEHPLADVTAEHELGLFGERQGDGPSPGPQVEDDVVRPRIRVADDEVGTLPVGRGVLLLVVLGGVFGEPVGVFRRGTSS